MHKAARASTYTVARAPSPRGSASSLTLHLKKRFPIRPRAFGKPTASRATGIAGWRGRAAAARGGGGPVATRRAAEQDQRRRGASQVQRTSPRQPRSREYFSSGVDRSGRPARGRQQLGRGSGRCTPAMPGGPGARWARGGPGPGLACSRPPAANVSVQPLCR